MLEWGRALLSNEMIANKRHRTADIGTAEKQWQKGNGAAKGSGEFGKSVAQDSM